MFYEYTHLGSVDYLKLESGRNFAFRPICTDALRLLCCCPVK